MNRFFARWKFHLAMDNIGEITVGKITQTPSVDYIVRTYLPKSDEKGVQRIIYPRSATKIDLLQKVARCKKFQPGSAHFFKTCISYEIRPVMVLHWKPWSRFDFLNEFFPLFLFWPLVLKYWKAFLDEFFLLLFLKLSPSLRSSPCTFY